MVAFRVIDGDEAHSRCSDDFLDLGMGIWSGDWICLRPRRDIHCASFSGVEGAPKTGSAWKTVLSRDTLGERLISLEDVCSFGRLSAAYCVEQESYIMPFRTVEPRIVL